MDVIIAIVLAVVVGVGVAWALWIQIRTLKDRIAEQDEQITDLTERYHTARVRIVDLEAELDNTKAELTHAQRSDIATHLSRRTP